MPEPWPFPHAADLEVIATRQVAADGKPVLYVFHDAEEDWAFFHYADPDEEDVVAAPLAALVANEPALRDLADLPAGWCAWRENRGEAWERAPIEE